MSFYSLSSYSQYRINQSAIGGTPTPPPFSNVNSFSFDGIDDYFVGVGGYTELSSGNAMSVSVWFKSSNYTSLGRLLFVGKHVEIYQNSALYSNTRGCFYYRLRGNFGNSFATLGGATNLGVGNLVDGQWHHLCFTWDGATTTAKVYEDGVLKVTNTSASGTLNSSTTESYSIGAENNGNNPIDGLIDEVGVWTTALSFADVTAIYNNGTPTDLNNNGLTAPTTWQRMGDLASWNGATWTMTDVNGSYTNRSINMVEANRTTDVPPNPFANTKSILLDGVDDFVNIGTTSLGITNAISISAWVKIPTTNTGGGGSNIQEIICEDATSGSNRNWALNWRGGANNNWQWVIWNTNGSVTVVTSTGLTPNDNQWHHILATYDGTSNADGVKLYVDGGTPFTATASSTGIRSESLVEATIGATSGGSALRLEGTLDEIAVWDSDQSANATSIYNGGVPNDISLLNPLGWWRCGDGDVSPILTDNGSGGNNGTMTNFSTFSTDVPFNYKSILFDGIDDYVDCGLGLGNSQGTITNFSVSMWIKPSVTSGNDLFFNIGNFSNSFGEIAFQLLSNTLFIKIDNSAYRVWMPYTNTSAWEHLAFVYDGSNSANTKMYINGVLQSPSTGGVHPSSLNLSGLKTIIGAGYSVSYPYSGLQDEVSYFNTTLSQSDITSIYNDGVPNDISSLSPLSWWRCGDGDTAPTLTDNGSASNDGTMTNFTTFSTDVPT